MVIRALAPGIVLMDESAALAPYPNVRDRALAGDLGLVRPSRNDQPGSTERSQPPRKRLSRLLAECSRCARSERSDARLVCPWTAVSRRSRPAACRWLDLVRSTHGQLMVESNHVNVRPKPPRAPERQQGRILPVQLHLPSDLTLTVPGHMGPVLARGGCV